MQMLLGYSLIFKPQKQSACPRTYALAEREHSPAHLRPDHREELNLRRTEKRLSLDAARSNLLRKLLNMADCLGYLSFSHMAACSPHTQVNASTAHDEALSNWLSSELFSE